MTTVFYIEDGRGRRPVEEGDFPLSVGGADADIRLPGVEALEPVAFIALADGEVFAQPASGEYPIQCNGTVLQASQWLRDGDVLEAGEARVLVSTRAGHVSFRVEQPGTERKATSTPVIVPIASHRKRNEASGTIVKPVDFKPAAMDSARRRRSIRPMAVFSWAFFGVLGLVAWFVFTGRSVSIEIEPEPDRMEVEGGLFMLDLGGRFLMRPGRYVLVAEKEGYARLETRIEVTDERGQSLHFSLDETPGVLAIYTTPVEGARVWIDGKELGATPMDGIELSPGEHEVRVEKENFKEVSARVRIAGGGAVEELNIALPPRWAAVTFRSQPSGARVQVSGELVGSTPVTADLLEGTHDYELSLSGRKPYRSRVAVVAGEALTLPVVGLDRLDGKLELASVPPASRVTVDGVYRGETPLALLLEPDEPHEITVSHAGYETDSRRMAVRSGESQTLRVELEPDLGVLEIACDPADAELYVNGEPRGRAGQVIRLAALPQQIEIRKDGYETFGTTVTPRPGYPQSLEVVLEKVGESPAARPLAIETSQGQELRLVGPLRFRMGASRREPGRRANETLREVEITRPYYLAAQEVSNRQFREFEKEHRSGSIQEHNLEIDHHPVVRVTWEDAVRYCNWLSERESLPPAYVSKGGTWVAVIPPTTGYRLPTEAEWERAARYPDGVNALKYPWGGSLPVAPSSGNFADVSAKGLVPTIIADYNDSYVATAPVDGFEPNALGIYNLGGNVAEWVNDCYSIPSPGGSEIERDPRGPEEGKFHVIRGSSWMQGSVTELRLSYRDYGAEARPDVGFRIARYPN